MSMLFLELPVRNLPTARAFYEALGFRIDEHSSDEHTAAVVVDDDFVVTLVTRDRFADLLTGEPGDPVRPRGPVPVGAAAGRGRRSDRQGAPLGRPALAAHHGGQERLHRQLRRAGRQRLAGHLAGAAARRRLTARTPTEALMWRSSACQDPK